MRIISAKTHGVMDYVTVLIFALAPSLLGLTGLPMVLSYGLAVVHFLMTIFTDFSLGFIKIIPLKLHGWVEFAVGIVLPIAPFVLGFESVALYYYVVVGIVIFVIGLLTQYEESAAMA